MTTSDVIQIALMGLLVVVTGIYAWRTHVISKATREQADASIQAVEEMRNARYDAVRPVIDIQMDKSPEVKVNAGLAAQKMDFDWGLSCKLHNIGLGPAIDVYSFIQVERKRQHKDFGTLSKDGKTPRAVNLSLDQEDKRLFLKVYYKDVYDRNFESGREVIIEEKRPVLGALKIRRV